MQAFLAGLCCAIACTASARADWAFTKWGMSVRELRAAAPMPISVARADERLFKRILRESSILAYVKHFVWHGHTLELRFGFDRHAKLNRVFLVADGDRFDELAAILAKDHGEPKVRADWPLPCRLWVDQEAADLIRLRRNRVTIVEQLPMQDDPTPACANGVDGAVVER